MKSKSKTIAILAISTALMFALGGLPFVFLVPLMFVCVTQSVKLSTIMGGIYGLVSLAYALAGTTVVAVAFISSPLIAIIPRIFVGLFASLSFRLAKKLLKKDNKFSRLAPYFIASSVGVIANTSLVVTALILFVPNVALGEMTVLIAVPSMLLSFIFEIIAINIIVPPLATTVAKALKIGDFKIDQSKMAENMQVGVTQVEVMQSNEAKTVNVDSNIGQ